jgi:transposase
LPHGSDVTSLPREPDILIGMIADLRDEDDKLRAMLATLKRSLFGARSKKVDAAAGQLPLGLEDLSKVPAEPQREAVAKSKPQDKPTRPKPVRNIGGLPKHLPREDVLIEPTLDACPCCQGALHRIGEDVSEMLDIVPAIIRVKRIRRPRYGCRSCESAVVQAPAPPRPVEGGLPTAALLAHVAVSKALRRPPPRLQQSATDAVATGHHRNVDPRLQAFGDHCCLLRDGPTPSPRDAGD